MGSVHHEATRTPKFLGSDLGQLEPFPLVLLYDTMASNKVVAADLAEQRVADGKFNQGTA